MSNPLFQQMGNNQNDLIQRFQQFKQSFRGDPQQQIQQMLNTGKISQQQYNQAVQKAQTLAKLLRM